ncbi:hypothetical protein FB451DRAFT_459082 [Mycena latifolia]|nr:hypothetical protein FB451DRAFT_459082 [Mycena latifolia]
MARSRSASSRATHLSAVSCASMCLTSRACVFALKIEDFLERRLQTQVFKSGLAKSIHCPRTLIRSRHIGVGRPVVNVRSSSRGSIRQVEARRLWAHLVVFALISPYGGGGPGGLSASGRRRRMGGGGGTRGGEEEEAPGRCRAVQKIVYSTRAACARRCRGEFMLRTHTLRCTALRLHGDADVS